MSVVRGAHFFRKLPRELTEATQLGGIVSLVGIATAPSAAAVAATKSKPKPKGKAKKAN